jgi:hypothetical protein
MVVVTDAETLAHLFHDTYERLAPSFGYQTRTESAVPWDDVPAANRALMEAVCAEILDDVLAPKPPTCTDDWSPPMSDLALPAHECVGHTPGDEAFEDAEKWRTEPVPDHVFRGGCPACGGYRPDLAFIGRAWAFPLPLMIVSDLCSVSVSVWTEEEPPPIGPPVRRIGLQSLYPSRSYPEGPPMAWEYHATEFSRPFIEPPSTATAAQLRGTVPTGWTVTDVSWSQMTIPTYRGIAGNLLALGPNDSDPTGVTYARRMLDGQPETLPEVRWS